MHVRRNELQYSDVKIGAEEMMKKSGALFKSKEPLYIATDELHREFFATIEAKHKVYQWKDFQPELEKELNQKIDHRIVGLVEQVICACGRVFVGTAQSTFTGLIPRLRGYIGAPDLHIYHATDMHSGPGIGASVAGSSGDFYNEWAGQWERIKPEL
jgi:hypothetical protein